MSAFTEYFTKVVVGYVYKCNQMAKLLSTGVRNKCLETEIQVLSMYIDLMETYTLNACTTAYDWEAICNNINYIFGDPGLGTITSGDITGITSGTIPTSGSGGSTVTDNEYTNVILIGTTTTVVTFPKALGTDPNGLDYAIKFTSWNSANESVGVEIIDRTNLGFSVKAYDENIWFEFTATLKNM